MTSKYFTVPSFARAKKNKEDLEKLNPQDPVLKDEDEKFLNQQIAEDKPELPPRHVQPAKITDDGEEKEATKEDLQSAGDNPDQAVIPETQPSTSDGTQEAEEDANMSKSYDDIMKERASERVQARKAKKKGSMDLPSQEDAEAATRGFNAAAAEKEAERQQGSTLQQWTTYLSSIRPGSSSSKKPDQTEDSTQRTWKDYASSYVPTLPASLLPKSKDARPTSPVYAEDGTIDEAATREKQEREVSVLLDNLSMSQINNRVFSFSDETQKIYERFALVLKDTINGAPTAYDDMDKLMREAGPKLEQQFKTMPPFVRTLVKSLPARMGGTLGPEVLAAVGEKPGADMKADLEKASKSGGGSDGVNLPAAGGSGETKGKEKEKKKKRTIPGLKSLLSKEGAVASMLRNVVNFLQTRFPFLASTTNVVMSLAVFILMFVFWYCHKRGKEVRLAQAAEAGTDGEETVSEAEEDDDDEVDDKAVNEEEKKYQDLLSDVESKAASLEQPNPAEVPLPGKEGTEFDHDKDSAS